MEYLYEYPLIRIVIFQFQKTAPTIYQRLCQAEMDQDQIDDTMGSKDLIHA